jgi:DNA replication protein DnaC
MLIQQTIERLHDLRLTAMASGLAEELQRPDWASLSFDERFGLLVDREWQARQQRRLTQRLRNAKLKQTACIEDIDYRHQRNLDRQVMQDLLSCRWISAKHNLIITGATGLGKTWLSCAVADQACREGFTAIYKQAQRLTFELNLARADGSYLKFLSQLAKADLLVLDDWGLARLEGQAQHDMLDVIDDRANIRSTLVTSQLPVSKWHGTVGDPSVADALLDRLVHAAIKIHLKGETLRKPTSKEATNAPSSKGEN